MITKDSSPPSIASAFWQSTSSISYPLGNLRRDGVIVGA
jgi:hypothetical protein